MKKLEPMTFCLFIEHYQHFEEVGKIYSILQYCSLELSELKHFIDLRRFRSILKEYYITSLLGKNIFVTFSNVFPLITQIPLEVQDSKELNNYYCL